MSAYGIVMGLVGLACIFAIMLLVPWSQFALAGILGLGLAALFALLTLHTLALTAWPGYLEQISVRKRGNGAHSEIRRTLRHVRSRG